MRRAWPLPPPVKDARSKSERQNAVGQLLLLIWESAGEARVGRAGNAFIAAITNRCSSDRIAEAKAVFVQACGLAQWP